jgi:hypothetical protein
MAARAVADMLIAFMTAGKQWLAKERPEFYGSLVGQDPMGATWPRLLDGGFIVFRRCAIKRLDLARLRGRKDEVDIFESVEAKALR